MDVPAVTTSSTPAEDASAVLALAQAEKSDATRRAHKSDFDLFADWCRARRNITLPAFLAGQASAGVRSSTLTRRLAAIKYARRPAGLPVLVAHEAVRAQLAEEVSRIAVKAAYASGIIGAGALSAIFGSGSAGL